MNLHDRDFDQMIRSRLNVEIPLSKQNRLAAWENIRAKADQQALNQPFENEILAFISPTSSRESVQKQVWHWLKYILSKEDSYHKAHAQSIHCYKSQLRYSSELTLQNLELIRHRWTYAV